MVLCSGRQETTLDPRKGGIMSLSEDRLSVDLIDGKLSITVGLGTLSKALEIGCPACGYTVSNPYMFAKDIVAQLVREQEDGTTPIHELLDKAANDAIEAGSPHVVLHGEESCY